MKKTYLLDLTALTSGLILTGAFAPFGYAFIAFISPALLLYTLLNSSVSRACVRSLLFGIGFFSTAISWVGISIYNFGPSSVGMASFITILLILTCTLMQGAFFPLLVKFFPKHQMTTALFGFPLLWVFGEYVRTWFFTSFPWDLLGYSQIQSPLRGFAPIFSVYGVSILTAMCSACLLLLVTHHAKKIRWVCFMLLIGLFATGEGLSRIHWTHPVQKPITVSLVQGNISMEDKWDNTVDAHINTYISLSQSHLNDQLIVWPETAIDGYETNVLPQLQQIRTMATQHHTAIITGLITGDSVVAYNSLIVLGNGKGEYNKRHLVPLGEYFPCRNILKRFVPDIPMSDFTAGEMHQQNLTAAGTTISPFICYEIIYPTLVRRSLGDANVLLTGSDDAWFGHSLAGAQHLEMAQMRSLETGRPQLFATNNGITAIINDRGEIVGKAPQYETTVLSGSVTPTAGKTPWVLMGPWLLVLLNMLCLALSWPWRKKN